MASSDDNTPLVRRKTAPAKRTAVKCEPAPKSTTEVKSEGLESESIAKKPLAKSKSTGDVTSPVVKREKKVFDMPGQTRDTPEENDGCRIFYTTLLEQRPDSDMAQKWCLQHGLLTREQAEAYLKKLGKSLSSPTKRPAAANGTTRKPAAKRVKKESDGDEKPAAKKTPAANPRAKTPKSSTAKVKRQVKKEESNGSDDFDDDSEPEIPLKKRPKHAAMKVKAENVKEEGGSDHHAAGVKQEGNADSDSDDEPLAARRPRTARKPAIKDESSSDDEPLAARAKKVKR